VVLEPIFQFIKSILRSRTDGREWRNGRQGRDTKRWREGLDLGLEETESSGRFCQSTQTGSEGSLKGSDVGIKLIVSYALFSS
jgi:hypothetical protein